MHLEGVVIPSAQKESPHESEQVIGFGSEPDVPWTNMRKKQALKVTRMNRMFQLH